MQNKNVDRRRFPRFDVPIAHTGVHVRTMDEDTFTRTGHALDISEGGVRFESSAPIAPGTQVAMRIDLPVPPEGVREAPVDGPGRAVFVVGNVVWCDVDEVGDASMALAITRFCRDGDKRRLLGRFGTGAMRRAA